MQRIAHRGYSTQAPENTMAAMRAALAAGADGIEFDVYLAADGVPVVIHDPTLERTTTGTGPVNALTAAQLAALDAGGWFAPAFAGEGVPTVRDVLLLLRDQATPYIELKGPGTAAPTVALLRELGMTAQAVVMSFDESLLQEMLALDATITVRLLLGMDDGSTLADGWGAAARRVGTHRLSIVEHVLTPERVAAVHADGYEIVAWTVDDPDRMRALRDLGIAGIIANDIGALMAIGA